MNGYSPIKQAKQCELLQRMLDQQKFADTTFIIGPDKQEYNVNRIFLAMISPVFEAMLFGQMIESESNSDVIIEDMEPDIFESVLNFAYCNDPKISEDNVLSLYQIADKYQMQTLLDWCEEYVGVCVNENNVCKFLNQSLRSNQTKIIRKCFQVIKGDVTKILISDGFLKMDIKTMREFLKNEGMKIKEDRLWQQVVKWAEYQSKTKASLKKNDDIKYNAYVDDEKDINHDKVSILKTVYDLIRFGLMDGKFFCTNVMSANVLSKDEIIVVLAYYQNPDPGCGKFNVTERTGRIGAEPPGALILLEYSIKMSSRYEKGSNTSTALMSKDLTETCTTQKETNQQWIQCKFGTGVHIKRIDIGPAKIQNHREGKIFGAKFLDDAKLYYSDKEGWSELLDVPQLEENTIKSINVDLKTDSISIDSNVSNVHLSIGCLRAYGYKM